MLYFIEQRNNHIDENKPLLDITLTNNKLRHQTDKNHGREKKSDGNFSTNNKKLNTNTKKDNRLDTSTRKGKANMKPNKYV